MLHDIHGNLRPDLNRELQNAYPHELTPLGHMIVNYVVQELKWVRFLQAVYGISILTLGLVNFLFLVWAVFL